MAKRDDDMNDDNNDYMESANEQSFSTLIAHLSDNNMQVGRNPTPHCKTLKKNNSSDFFF